MTSSKLINEVKDAVLENAAMFEFTYNGKSGNIDPVCTPKDGDRFLLFFDGTEQTVNRIDDVFSTPFVNGQRLTDIAEQVVVG